MNLPEIEERIKSLLNMLPSVEQKEQREKWCEELRALIAEYGEHMYYKGYFTEGDVDDASPPGSGLK